MDLSGYGHWDGLCYFLHGRDVIHVRPLSLQGAPRLTSSRAPTSGGQYHWVSEFAPKSIQKFLSYIVGWVCVLAWHTGIAAGGYVFANMLIALLALNHNTYVPKPFHGTLIVIAVVVVCMVFNTLLARRLPFIEGLLLILHICGFFVILIPLWVLSPGLPASEVFGPLQDNGGWGSNGLVYLLGMVGPVYALLGRSSCKTEMLVADAHHRTRFSSTHVFVTRDPVNLIVGS